MGIEENNNTKVIIWAIISLCCSCFVLGSQISKYGIERSINNQVNTVKLEKNELDTLEINGVRFIPIK